MVNFLWPKIARLGPCFDAKNPPGKDFGDPLFRPFPGNDAHQLSLGAQNGGFGWGPRSLCWKSLCAFFHPLLQSSLARHCAAPLATLIIRAQLIIILCLAGSRTSSSSSSSSLWLSCAELQGEIAYPPAPHFWPKGILQVRGVGVCISRPHAAGSFIPPAPFY